MSSPDHHRPTPVLAMASPPVAARRVAGGHVVVVVPALAVVVVVSPVAAPRPEATVVEGPDEGWGQATDVVVEEKVVVEEEIVVDGEVVVVELPLN